MKKNLIIDRQCKQMELPIKETPESEDVEFILEIDGKSIGVP